MKVKELIEIFNSLTYPDELIIFEGCEKLWQGFTHEKQVPVYLQDKEVYEMWLGSEEICISLK